MVDLDLIPHQFIYSVKARLPDPRTGTFSAEALQALAPRAEPPVNMKVNVAIPGLGLLAIKECMVEYDLCTNVLNERLRGGWRILAICPQPDQRRPDYILGRGDIDE